MEIYSNSVIPSGYTIGDPLQFDFSQGYADTWMMHEAYRCNVCNAILCGYSDIPHSEIEATDCKGFIEGKDIEGDRYYPVYQDLDPELVSKIIADFPFSVVSFLEETEVGKKVGFVPNTKMDIDQFRGQARAAYWTIATYCRLAEKEKHDPQPVIEDN